MTQLPAPDGALPPLTQLEPCNRKGCARFANVALALDVPFRGKSAHEAKPLRIFIGLVVCAQHQRQARPAEFLTDQFKAGVGRAAIEGGRGALDFDRALLQGVELDDPGYLGYLAVMARAKGQPTQ